MSDPHAGSVYAFSTTKGIIDRILVVLGAVAYGVVVVLCFGEAGVMRGFGYPQHYFIPLRT